ncbi:MAG: hypothetical protein U5S82_07320 [Gammaproteobacteria bacterium]|nr:hypothetical protein [Gammaproteobacteria bacterium]
MNTDFSKLNLQYLIQARDLAHQAPQCAGALMGVPIQWVEQIGALKPDDLARSIDIRIPLLVPRRESWWWTRLFQALQSGRTAEVDAVLAHAGLLAAP